MHEPLLELTGGKDPIGIAGITDYRFLQIVSEVGTDMSPWPTEKDFTSWLKVSPLSASSGKVKKRVTIKRHNRDGTKSPAQRTEPGPPSGGERRGSEWRAQNKIFVASPGLFIVK